MITTLSTLSISLMILLPVGLAIMWRRRFSPPWWLFCAGMAAFVASQLYHIPLNNWLTDLGVIGEVSANAPRLLRTAIILGLSAGFSETLARVVLFALLFRLDNGTGNHEHQGTRWQAGVMIGLGHGGIEAMLFGSVMTAAVLSSLLALQGVDLDTLGLPSAQLEVIETQMVSLAASPWLVFMPLLERALAMILHVALSLLVWQAFRWRRPLGIALAVFYHAAVDATIVYAGQFIENALLLEGLLLLMVLPGAIWVGRSWPAGEIPDRRPVRSLGDQLSLFSIAVRKEFLQQWRTKRILVVMAVFLLFGLGSPLVARFTPQIVGSFEQAAQFADLIPTPSTPDAMDQYIRNITQFGFIIAILMGMGSVAGEMEKGTAAMILSKPLPRWAFVLSKFTAQALVFAAGFALSALGAYYYTEILFNGFDFLPFMFGNGLLLLWLMVYVAVTLLASTLVRSTGAAAGIALIGSVILLLAGTLPRVGALAPAGLVIWARQLGLEPVTIANGGALAGNIVIIIVCLVSAVALFETREL